VLVLLAIFVFVAQGFISTSNQLTKLNGNSLLTTKTLGQKKKQSIREQEKRMPVSSEKISTNTVSHIS